MLSAVSLLVALVAVCGSAIGQQAGGGRGNRGSAPADMQGRMEEMRKQMLDQVRQQLGFSEEDWEVVKPRYEKVAELNRELSGGMRGMAFGGPAGGRRGGRGADAAGDAGDDRGTRPAETPRPEDQTEMGKARQKLRDVLDNASAPADEIQAALKDYRTARVDVQKQLEQARDSLKELLSARQEAMLVSTGILE
jgi:hypothetical protein